MMSQNLLNIVDTAMVSSLGDTALAAVGLAGFAGFMCTAFIMGAALVYRPQLPAGSALGVRTR
jgi:MATE family multidrug resistance protein